MTASPPTPSRGRGRPKASALSGEALRHDVINSAAVVYAQYGYHKTTVELILKAANVSRPTFYRFFKDKHQVLDMVITQHFEALRMDIATVASQPAAIADIIKLSIEHYFNWCEHLGPLVKPIYNEINDPLSPVKAQRQRIIDDFLIIMNQLALRPDSQILPTLMYDTILRAVEHIGSCVFANGNPSLELMNQGKIIAQRIVLASLAESMDSASIPSLDSLALKPPANAANPAHR